MRARPSLVLVHSPLTGPSTWEPVATELRGRGYVTHVPSVAGEFADGGPYFPRLAARVADGIVRDGGTGPVLLAAHSGAGALLPAAAAAAEGAGVPVAGLLHADAPLPHPGRSWFDTVPVELRERLNALARDGELPPWDEWFPPGTIEELLPDGAQRAAFRAELPRLPLGWFEEPAPELPARYAPSPSGYLRLSGAYEDEARRAEREGRPVVRRDAHHLALLTEPRATADALAELAGALTE
ncbi:alpha/beta fold hydrolase [Streptomyces armeniacus]|uniref:Alpha/beta fold hydrolase n=1 Tax=Streptomyces armeniacus TaxID=83291 RepID=A0A345XUC4_9ACTN|nr:alpha/beta fold hydrolase [Streptomyces armeniacus]AXK35240.1 alpha/beta fold hydrolase [Streptomyces armeniacus]